MATIKMKDINSRYSTNDNDNGHQDHHQQHHQQHQHQHQQHPVRALHTIRLSAIRHNYNIVSAAANKQKCSVITVVKADGYGHGAIETALHLADYCGADAFAVATLEEGIALRKAFMESDQKFNHTNRILGHTSTNATAMRIGTNLGGTTMVTMTNHNAQNHSIVESKKSNSNNSRLVPITSSSLFQPPTSYTTSTPLPPKAIEVQSQSDISSISTNKKHQKNHNHQCALTQPVRITNIQSTARKNLRSNNIRILVLGPPTNIPHDFNLYIHYNIEVMISSTKMARALMEWVADDDGRKIAEVDQVANERKKELLLESNDIHVVEKNDHGLIINNGGGGVINGGNTNSDIGCGIGGINGTDIAALKRGQAATLTTLEGNALGKEVLAILNKAKDAANIAAATVVTTPTLAATQRASVMKNNTINNSSHVTGTNQSRSSPPNDSSSASSFNTSCKGPFPFKGIEDIAKQSRIRELAVAKITAHMTGEDDDSNDHSSDSNTVNDEMTNTSSSTITPPNEEEHNSSSMSRTSTSSSFGNHIINENDLDDTALVSTVSSAVANAAINNGAPIKTRKKIRWHALVDSGMGRLGFKSIEDENDNTTNVGKGMEGESEYMHFNGGDQFEPNGTQKREQWKNGPNKETVSIIKSMCHAEIDGAPIEFYGMCTHMAEASSNSSYTNEQMTRFKSLLKSVRQAGLSVPSISTDNSAALLTPSLTHFDPAELLSQPNCDTRGYVRSGGAVYGQRPAFTHLRAVSTLTASVRHIATMEKGESVGYDRAYIAEKNVRIATLSIGFADGYPRELGNGKGKVSIHGKKYPIAGNVCMDMLMVDLGSVEDESNCGTEICVGDIAYLWGPENDDLVDGGEGNIRLQDIAKTLNTTQSALTCGLDKVRVQRQYVIN